MMGGLQWEFVRFGEGYAVRSVCERTYLSVDLAAFVGAGSAPAVATAYPTCWEIEAQRMDEDLTHEQQLEAEVAELRSVH